MTDNDQVKHRIEREKLTVSAMMRIFCRDHHHTDGILCEDCDKLLDYARRRLDSCPFQEKKPACNHCTVHCYSKDMRVRVQDVMRYAGPRMVFRHPLLSLYHLFDKMREVPELSKRKE
ncbi:nitrous oxide-stimulated promoter family protein [Candidatus Thiodiazotropha sp. CDECU1]|uniref:nitrous oxide-stimulated promoter family protein n=1 Tax=Candidatus Thiodiazotropha sp. CDECU1 TaxID=3065865 RepID=UPI00292CF89B|nr:nitrous oxide-stimulated promoter family protein [Candidatus Thiodiazotropha sp. CDECU1]